MREIEVDAIRSLPLFRGVTPAHFDALMGAAFLQRFPDHVVLISEGELPDFLHIVVEGIVELFASHDGRETTIDVIRPVTTFILAAVIRDEVYLQSARTLSDARILMIPAAIVRDVFGHDAAFARAIVEELALRYRGVVRGLKNEKLRSSAERLANWILQADTQQGRRGHVKLAFDKRVLASQLGMTPENLSRTLVQLTRHGALSHGRGIVIQNRDALEEFARPNSLIDN